MKVVPVKGHVVANWEKTSYTRPAAFLAPTTIEEVQAAVRDTEAFPTPLRAVGLALSPSGVHQNNGGSIIQMSTLNKILGLVTFKNCGPDYPEVQCLKCQAGVTFADVNEYLNKEHGREMAFSAEIGLSTVGGTAFATTKDSSIGPVCPSGGLGDFQSCIMGIDLVGPDGDLQEWRLFDADGKMNMEFQTLLGSQGTRGLAVVVYVATRKCIPVTIQVSFLKFLMNGEYNAEVAKSLVAVYEKNHKIQGNVFAVIGLKSGYCSVEERIPTEHAGMAPLSCLVKPFYVPMKKHSIQTCSAPTWFNLARKVGMNGSFMLRYNSESKRRGYRYPIDLPTNVKRLTFSYYSFDYAEFNTVIEKGLTFLQQYQKEHGFAPNGMAVYWVTRSGLRDAGPYAGKGAGTSFSFDPVYDTPEDPKWAPFIQAFTRWAAENGGRPSLNQTPEIEKEPEFASLCVSGTPHPRFTSVWLQRIFDAKQPKEEEEELAATAEKDESLSSHLMMDKADTPSRATTTCSGYESGLAH